MLNVGNAQTRHVEQLLRESVDEVASFVDDPEAALLVLRLIVKTASP